MGDITQITARQAPAFGDQPGQAFASLPTSRFGSQVWMMGPGRERRANDEPTAGTLEWRREAATAERDNGRWLRDQALRSFLEDPAHELTFAVDDRGRPHLSRDVDAPMLDFSLTHTDGAVGVAVTANARIGLDLERLRPVTASRFRRAFSTAEWYAISGAEDANAELLRIWTRKEALLKAIGVGIRRPLAEVLAGAVQRDGKLQLCAEAGLDAERRWWSVFTLDAIPGCVAACAVGSLEPDVTRPTVHVVEPPLAQRSSCT